MHILVYSCPVLASVGAALLTTMLHKFEVQIDVVRLTAVCVLSMIRAPPRLPSKVKLKILVNCPLSLVHERTAGRSASSRINEGVRRHPVVCFPEIHSFCGDFSSDCCWGSGVSGPNMFFVFLRVQQRGGGLASNHSYYRAAPLVVYHQWCDADGCTIHTQTDVKN